DGEEVHGHRGLEVILQERSPRLRRWSPAAHVLADAGLTDVDAEFEQLSMNAGRAPERILSAHSSDQLADVVPNRWSSWPAGTALPCPPQPERPPMPCDDGIRLDDDEA